MLSALTLLKSYKHQISKFQPRNSEKRDFWEGIWLGLNDRLTEGTFVWANTGLKATYTNWLLPDEPNDSQVCYFYSHLCHEIKLISNLTPLKQI